MISSIISLIRPHQWLKNGFVFVPLFFDRHLFQHSYWIPALWAFLAYSLVASAIYCFNDIYDIEADRLHPKKKFRPIASGRVSKSMAYGVMIILLLAAIAIISFNHIAIYTTEPMIGDKRWLVVAGLITLYFLLNLCYCIWLKHKAIIDVFTIAFGFVLRLLVGGVVTSVLLSKWIVLMTFLLALFLAFAKRRDDVIYFEHTGTKARNNIDRYNSDFMNQALSVIASITMVAYIMYTISDEVVQRIGNDYLYLTAFFVLAGILRYLQVTLVDKKSGSPTKVLLRDHFIQACIGSWLTFLLSFYIYKIPKNYHNATQNSRLRL